MPDHTARSAASGPGKSQPHKARENKLRRLAERQGLKLHKNRRRDPSATHFGTYGLTPHGSEEVAYGLTLEEVEMMLTGRSGLP